MIQLLGQVLRYLCLALTCSFFLLCLQIHYVLQFTWTSRLDTQMESLLLDCYDN